MWNPQGIYNQYILRTPAIITGKESVRGLYNYPCAKVAVIHGSSVSDKEIFRETFKKRDLRFFHRSWSGEPDLEGISDTLHALEDFRPDTIIAIGGGSVVDGAKLCRLFLEFPYYKPGLTSIYGELFTTTFIAVPTTIGSGAEISSAAVYIDKESGSKQMVVMHELQPEVIVYDDRYVKDTPDKLLCESALDACAHLVEGYVSNIDNDMVGTMAECGLSVLKNELDKFIGNKHENIEFCRLQQAGQIGGIVQNHCIVGAAHAVAHQLSKFGFSHGEAVGLLLPSVIKLNMEDDATLTKYERLAVRSGFQNTDAMINFLMELIRSGNIYSRKSELVNILKTNITNPEFRHCIINDRGGKGNPVEITGEYIERLIRSI